MHYTIPERDFDTTPDRMRGSLPQDIKRLDPNILRGSSSGGEVGPADYSADDLRDTLLAALVVLASRSKRRQADLSAALRRMNLPVTAEQVMNALAKLREEGCVQDWVPLYDGGMLVSVTNRGMDQTGRVGSWRFLEQIHALNA
jgi:hypothetical protein